MSTPLAAVALPVAAAGALAVNALSSAAEGFSSLLRQKSEPASEASPALSVEARLEASLEAPLGQLRDQLARRLRAAGAELPEKLEVRMDEFGLLRAYAAGQEEPEISRWLSEDFDLVRQFGELQSTAASAGLGAALSIEVDLASPSVA